MPFFTKLTPQQIGAEIVNAQQRVILAVPGVEPKVAEALIAAHQRLGAGAVQVVLDVSAAVCRLGYGEQAAVEQLAAAGVPLHQQPGLRLGVLICDRHGWSFAKTPRLVESEPDEQDAVCNAIALTEAQIQALRDELPATMGAADAEAPPTNPVVGIEAVKPDTVQRVKRALDIAPPQQFDLARQTNVYTALVQFVELEFEGFSIQNRRVRLPETLPVIASEDRALKDRVSASLKLLNDVQRPDALQDISTRLNELRAAYLIPVGHAGRVILKSKLKDFEKELAEVEKALAECKGALESDIQKALDETVAALVPDLARAVMADPPSKFRGRYPITDDAAKDFVRAELERVFPASKVLVGGMKIYRFYKDATYVTLKDPDFAQRINDLIPESVRKEALLEESIAAKARAVGRGAADSSG